jgi:hypothetical protein
VSFKREPKPQLTLSSSTGQKAALVPASAIPGDPVPYVAEAERLAAAGRLKTARDLLTRARAMEPQTPEVRIRIAKSRR